MRAQCCAIIVQCERVGTNFSHSMEFPSSLRRPTAGSKARCSTFHASWWLPSTNSSQSQCEPCCVEAGVVYWELWSSVAGVDFFGQTLNLSMITRKGAWRNSSIGRSTMSKSIHQRIAEKEAEERHRARRRRSFIQNVGYTLMAVSLVSCGATLVFTAAEAVEDTETRRMVTTGAVFFGTFLFGLIWNWIWQAEDETPVPDKIEEFNQNKAAQSGKSRRRSRRRVSG